MHDTYLKINRCLFHAFRYISKKDFWRWKPKTANCRSLLAGTRRNNLRGIPDLVGREPLQAHVKRRCVGYCCILTKNFKVLDGVTYHINTEFDFIYHFLCKFCFLKVKNKNQKSKSAFSKWNTALKAHKIYWNLKKLNYSIAVNERKGVLLLLLIDF